MDIDEVIRKSERGYLFGGPVDYGSLRPALSSDDVQLLMHAIACKVREQQKEIAELRLLIQHEEEVRTRKLRVACPAREQSFYRRPAEPFKRGDRVVVHGMKGVATIERISGARVKLIFDGTPLPKWVPSYELQHTFIGVKETA